jgi:transposase
MVNIRPPLCASRAAPTAFSVLSLPSSPAARASVILSFVEASPPNRSRAAAPCGLPACQQALTDARQQAGYYKALHARAVHREANLKAQLADCRAAAAARRRQREDQLQQRIDDLEAEVRLLKQRLYGRSCEGHHTPNTLAHAPAGDAPVANPGAPPPTPRRPRGQQRGRPGHGRRHYQELPVTDEVAQLPPEQQCCRNCGRPFAPCGSAPAVTTLVEVTVRAHRRRIRRRRYRPTCACAAHPDVVAAPPPPRLIANTALGVSVWVLLLLDKYADYRPTYRLLAAFRRQGLDLALGTVTDGLRRLLPLLEPIDEALREHLQRQQHWHGDETRWQVFASVEGKVGHLWYLWLVLSAEVAVFTLAAGRGHDVPEAVLGPEARGIFNADRYRAYPAMRQVKEGQITLALCWAHQRRDFIEAERGHPALHAWASAWLERIATLYRLNEARLQVWPKDAAAFAAADGQLRAALAGLAEASAQEQAQAELPLACRKVLQSLDTHWAGLTVFVDHPAVPMDNNNAERAERGPVVGRKNYYGSGAVWAGQLAAVMFSIIETLRLWELNAQQWLTGYLTACAEAGGRAPPELRRWLPWSMTEGERAVLRLAEPAPAPRAADTS